jgi:polysaccharide pyruvyl transferase WcaK-like protein
MGIFAKGKEDEWKHNFMNDHEQTKIGIITYHAAHNFGSALQAYATQEFIKKLGCAPKIINYIVPAHYEFYRLYRTKYGERALLNDITRLPFQKLRLERINKFDRFAHDYFDLTERVTDPTKAIQQENTFDVMVSGSDQIWNKHSCELEISDWKYMTPFLLKGFQGKKVSYASSIGRMNRDELEVILPELKKFDAISMREESSCHKLNDLGISSVNVLDPTFLLQAKEWIEKLGLYKTEEKYVIYYSLKDKAQFDEYLPILIKLSEHYHQKVLVITPYFDKYRLPKNFVRGINIGPVEFMNALYNSCCVVTDSYHGTILAINFNRSVFSICPKDGAEFRKTEILKKLRMESRIITKPEEVLVTDQNIDYSCIVSILEDQRAESSVYLKQLLYKP